MGDMKVPKAVIHNAATAVHAMQKKGGAPEARAQAQAMSKSKRVRVKRPVVKMGY